MSYPWAADHAQIHRDENLRLPRPPPAGLVVAAARIVPPPATLVVPPASLVAFPAGSGGFAASSLNDCFICYYRAAQSFRRHLLLLRV